MGCKSQFVLQELFKSKNKRPRNGNLQNMGTDQQVEDLSSRILQKKNHWTVSADPKRILRNRTTITNWILPVGNHQQPNAKRRGRNGRRRIEKEKRRKRSFSKKRNKSCRRQRRKKKKSIN